MVVDERPRAGQPAAVDDRCVVERVREDDVALARERLDDARVGQVAGSEEDARLAVLELRDALLETAVDRHVAADQARRSGAGAPAHDCVGGGLAHARVVS